MKFGNPIFFVSAFRKENATFDQPDIQIEHAGL